LWQISHTYLNKQRLVWLAQDSFLGPTGDAQKRREKRKRHARFLARMDASVSVQVGSIREGFAAVFADVSEQWRQENVSESVIFDAALGVGF
jgi:hypothetical protein